MVVTTVAPHPGLAHYVAEEGWPQWACQIITASQSLAEQARANTPIGIPVS